MDVARLPGRLNRASTIRRGAAVDQVRRSPDGAVVSLSLGLINLMGSACALAEHRKAGQATLTDLSGQFRELGAVGLNLPDRLDDVIHILASGQQQVLGYRDGCRTDLSVAL